MCSHKMHANPLLWAHVSTHMNAAVSGHQPVNSCTLSCTLQTHCSGGHLLPCTEWHRRTRAVSRPWSPWCRGGGIPTQWREEGGGFHPGKEGTPIPPTDHIPASSTPSFLPVACSVHKETPLHLGLNNSHNLAEALLSPNSAPLGDREPQV